MTSNQKKRLDDLWSQSIRKRDKCCRICGRNNVEAAHIFVRDNLSTRWDLENGMSLCHKCHRWGHDNPKKFEDFARSQLGDDRFKALRAKAMTIVKNLNYKTIREEVK